MRDSGKIHFLAILLLGSLAWAQPLATSGQAFSTSGGSGTVNVTLPAGQIWTALSGASWLTFTGAVSGNGNGAVGYQVAANGGTARSTTITVAGFTFTVEQQSDAIPGRALIGSMAHLAAAENWTTSFTIVNKDTIAATARLSFFGDAVDPSGNGPLLLPLAFPQQAAALPFMAATLDRPLAANASLVINTAGAQVAPVLVGSGRLEATGVLDGFAIFHQLATQQEAVVPLETRSAGSYFLAFDNTSGVVLGVALENVSAVAGNVGVVIRDDNGTVIGPAGATIALAGSGHTSFVLSDPVQGFAVTANRRGTIEFKTPALGRISVLGLRFTPPNNALTTIPALANVGINGGSIAHLATGNGWQTTFVLVNVGAGVAQTHLKFFGDGGAPLLLPIGFPQSGGGTTQTASGVDQTLAAGATLIVQSAAPLSDPAPTVGSAQLTTTGNVSGFVIFRYNPSGQEAVVPLESRNASAYILAFDNTAGIATGVAINSVATQAVNIPVTVRNEAGTQIATDLIPLAVNGHLAFTLVSDKYPGTANIRGTIEFGKPTANALIGALGIRIPPAAAHTFTTLPALAK